MIIAVDFDGTCVTHEYPYVGREIGAPPVLHKIVQSGHKLILYTMRCNLFAGHSETDGEIQPVPPGNYLTDAISWFNKHELPLYGINTNPTQRDWTTSPKVYAHRYIDDAAIGIPLIRVTGVRPYVDWARVEQILREERIITI